MATQCALSLNAKAVTMLHDDMGFAEAGPIFRQALQAVASSLAIGTTTDEADAQQGTLLENVPLSLNEKVSLLEESFSPDNSFCFYSRAFLIDAESSSYVAGVGAFVKGEDHDSTSTPLQFSTINQLQLSATIFYNWGLASHYKAICTGASRDVHKAMKLYNKALEIMTTCKEVTFNDSLALLDLALSNNLGHCSSCLSDEVMSRMFQERLKSGLVTFLGTEKFQCEYSFFYKNFLVTMVKTFASAA